VVSDVYDATAKDLQLTGSSGTVFDLHLTGVYSQANFVLTHGYVAFSATPPAPKVATSDPHAGDAAAAPATFAQELSDLSRLQLLSQYMAGGFHGVDRGAANADLKSRSLEPMMALATPHAGFHAVAA
jgi:hypothetical protein